MTNTNVSANVLRGKFYVCPVCGNVLFGMGEAAVSCHGILLPPLEAEEPDEGHRAKAETVEDEYFLTIDHPMSKDHHILFAAAVSCDRVQLVKLYPEGNAEARFQKRSVKKLYYCCNRDGLYCLKV